MLNFPNSGSGRPFLNLDARSGLWRVSTPEGPQMVDLTGRTLALDIANAVQGWLHVGPAGADWQPIEDGKWGSAPSADHKAGVELLVVLEGGDVRQLRGNSRALTSFISAVARDAATHGLDPNGPLPLIRLEQPKLIKVGQGTSVDVRYRMAPVAKWTARAVLDGEPADEPAPAPKVAPKAAAKPAAVAADESLEF